MKLSAQATAAAEVIIDAYVRLQAELAPLDHACDVMIDAMTKLRDGVSGPNEELVRRLQEVERQVAGLPAAIQGLAIIAPAIAIIQREIHAP